MLRVKLIRKRGRGGVGSKMDAAEDEDLLPLDTTSASSLALSALTPGNPLFDRKFKSPQTVAELVDILDSDEKREKKRKKDKSRKHSKKS